MLGSPFLDTVARTTPHDLLNRHFNLLYSPLIKGKQNSPPPFQPPCILSTLHFQLPPLFANTTSKICIPRGKIPRAPPSPSFKKHLHTSSLPHPFQKPRNWVPRVSGGFSPRQARVGNEKVKAEAGFFGKTIPFLGKHSFAFPNCFA